MLKRFGASKHRKAASALKSPAITVTVGQPETTSEEEPASIIENNKVNPMCEINTGEGIWHPD